MTFARSSLIHNNNRALYCFFSQYSSSSSLFSDPHTDNIFRISLPFQLTLKSMNNFIYFFVSFSIRFTSTSFQMNYNNTHIHLYCSHRRRKNLSLKFHEIHLLQTKTAELYSIFFLLLLFQTKNSNGIFGIFNFPN